ncbi:hypothetical protein Dimus_039693 [Dionaea muscipula]
MSITMCSATYPTTLTDHLSSPSHFVALFATPSNAQKEGTVSVPFPWTSCKHHKKEDPYSQPPTSSCSALHTPLSCTNSMTVEEEELQAAWIGGEEGRLHEFELKRCLGEICKFAIRDISGIFRFVG